MKKIRQKISNAKWELASTAVALTPGIALATEGGINLNINLEQIFSYANQFLTALMPIVGLTVGLSLAMMVIRTLKNMFF